MRYSELMESEIPELKFSDLPDYTKLDAGGHIDVTNRELTSLSGSPSLVQGHFDCGENKLSTLVGGPKEVKGLFRCRNNARLTNLIGSPTKVDGNFYFGTVDHTISLNGITTKEIDGILMGYGEVTNLMSLWKIKGITSVCLYQRSDISNIINRHIGNPRGKLAFQAEMISSGFKEYL